MFHLRLRLLAFSTLTAATALTGVAFACQRARQQPRSTH